MDWAAVDMDLCTCRAVTVTAAQAAELQVLVRKKLAPRSDAPGRHVRALLAPTTTTRSRSRRRNRTRSLWLSLWFSLCFQCCSNLVHVAAIRADIDVARRAIGNVRVRRECLLAAKARAVSASVINVYKIRNHLAITLTATQIGDVDGRGNEYRALSLFFDKVTDDMHSAAAQADIEITPQATHCIVRECLLAAAALLTVNL